MTFQKYSQEPEPPNYLEPEISILLNEVSNYNVTVQLQLQLSVHCYKKSKSGNQLLMDVKKILKTYQE